MAALGLAVLSINFFLALVLNNAVWLSGLITGVVVWHLAARYYEARSGIPVEPFWRVRPRGPGRWTAPVLVCCALLIAPKAAWLFIVGLDPHVPLGEYRKLSDAILITLTFPIQEEVVFRGVVLFGLIACGVGLWLAILVQALAFACIHGLGDPWAVTAVLLSGVAFGQLATLTKGLVPPLIVHCTGNLSEVARIVGSGALDSGNRLASDQTTIIPAIVGPAACIVVLLVWSGRQTPPPSASCSDDAVGQKNGDKPGQADLRSP